VLVALNSVFQIVAFAGLGWFYLHVLPGWLGLSQTDAHFSITTIVVSVLVFLGIPLVAGFTTRTLGERRRGRDWYETRFLPTIGPLALYGLLFTIVILFALQGHTITSHPADVARIAVPLIAYFAIMFGGSFALGHRLRLGYPKTATLAFTAAGNNFELAIAVAIGVFGVTSGQALAGVVGPLIEVPVLVGLVYVALWARHRLYPAAPSPADLPHQTDHPDDPQAQRAAAAATPARSIPANATKTGTCLTPPANPSTSSARSATTSAPTSKRSSQNYEPPTDDQRSISVPTGQKAGARADTAAAADRRAAGVRPNWRRHMLDVGTRHLRFPTAVRRPAPCRCATCSLAVHAWATPHPR
jgi:Sodium Bile acid symporter family